MNQWLKTITVSFSTSLWLSVAASASPLAFNFSFTNATYPETVTGIITGLADNTIGTHATDIQVTSNTLGFGIGDYGTGGNFSLFSVSSGVMTFFSVSAFSFNNSAPEVTCCSLGMSADGAALTDDPSLISVGAVGAGAPVTFTPVTVAVPAPATLPLFATGLLGLGLRHWRRKRKQAAAV